ncbi:MAG: aldehyde ferredoxin oxidoreductase family protein [Chloroflexi bacterium]|nr:aldehyde ferredoxin oxidoreductase family protein [Chloroflexota bacterium]
MGYTLKILKIDLSSGVCAREEIPEKISTDYVGGRGLGVKYLYDNLPQGVDPLSPANKLVLATGPLAGTGALSSSRWMAVSKSPLTQTIFRSVGGADFGAWLKWAGLDAIVIEGKAAGPVYLYIEKDRCEIREAGDLRGKGTEETQVHLRDRHGDGARIACIGPAGENLVRYAAIFSGPNCAGRGGLGAVMGSKNCKAVVVKANRQSSIARPQELKEIIKEHLAFTKAAPAFVRFSTFGPTGNAENCNVHGIFPTRNFREGSLEGWENFRASEYAKLREKDMTCYGCPIHCGKRRVVKTGLYAGVAADGPDYESIWAFTGPIASTDIGATIAGNALCDDLGIDTVTMGNAIGFAYELFEKGILTTKDTGGRSLTYGDHQTMIDLIKMVGRREGLGNILAEGVREAARIIGKGSEAYAVHMKGLEPPAYDPRGAKANGLAFATSNMGANHNIGYCKQEIFNIPDPRPVNRYADGGFADVVMFNQDETAMYEVGIACLFPALLGMMSHSLFLRMMSAVTGVSEFGDKKYLFKVGERIYNLERLFNIREGLTRKDDGYPPRLANEPLRNAGPSEGQLIRRQEETLDEYYQVRGWDLNGVPTPEKLRELGL